MLMMVVVVKNKLNNTATALVRPLRPLWRPESEKREMATLSNELWAKNMG